MISEFAALRVCGVMLGCIDGFARGRLHRQRRTGRAASSRASKRWRFAADLNADLLSHDSATLDAGAMVRCSSAASPPRIVAVRVPDETSRPRLNQRRDLAITSADRSATEE